MPHKAPTGKSLLVLALLIIAGLLGNYRPIPLFFGADFLLGSIAVLLILYVYGLGWGMFAAVIVHSYTTILWGHPYGFINFTSEALFVGFFLKKGRNLLVLDWVFWLLLGMPLVWLFFGVVMHMDAVTVTFIMFKQAINGIFNALVATLIVCYVPLDRIFQRSQLSPNMSFRESLFNLLVMMVLIPALLLTMFEANRAKERLEAGVIADLQSQSVNVQSFLRAWYLIHLKPLQELATLAGRSSMTPSGELQHETEILKSSFEDFVTMHVDNAEGCSIAFEPRVNAKEESTLGLDFSGRAWFQEVKTEQRPVVSKVFVGEAATFRPIVVLSVPVIRENLWLGCATAALDLTRVKEALRTYLSDRTVNLTITDSQSRVIASTAPDRAPMQFWVMGKTAASKPLGDSVYFWQPSDGGLPSMTRWKQSLCVQETTMEPELPWKLTAEAPVAPLQNALYRIYAINLAIMVCLTSLALLLSQIFSRGLTRPLAQLAKVTVNLPERLSGSGNIDWPASSTREVDLLIGNFESMSKALEANFHEIRAQGNELRQVNLGLEQEIQERKHVEKELEESVSLLNATLESTVDGILAVDSKGGVISFNRKFADMWRLSAEVLSTRDAETFLQSALRRSKDPDGFLNRVREIYGQPEVQSFDSFELADGRVFERYSQPQYLGDLIVGRVWSFRDVTQRLHAEEEARQSEGRYRAFFETSRDCVFITSRDGKWVHFNEAAVRLFGCESREELQETRIPDLYQNPQDRDRHVQRIAQQGFSEDYAVNLRKKDGAIINTLITSVPRKDKDGQIIGYQGTIRDVTEKRRLEERLQRAERMEALGTMAGGVAHDLNNVLGIVVGYSELLLNKVDESSSAKAYIMEVLKGAQRAATIVQDLLTLTRRGVQNTQVLNLNNIVIEWQKSPEFANLFAYHSKVRMTTDLEADLLNTLGSSVHLGKTFMNLISNAAEAMPNGGVITVKTTNRYLDKPVSGYDEVKEGDYIVLTISDTGEGIPADDLKRIFEPFYTKKVMGRSGTGLGLTVVWGTVKDHYGYVNVESQEGKGTTFSLYFPVTREELSAEVVAAATSEYMGKGETILVVDDVKEQRELASTLLGMLNYKVTSVSSGEEAVEYIKKCPVDMVVLDMIMDPGMDGLDTYSKIIEINPHQRAIIVSGFAETERVNKAQSLGAGAYVKKPYLLENLGLAVRKEFDRPA